MASENLGSLAVWHSDSLGSLCDRFRHSLFPKSPGDTRKKVQKQRKAAPVIPYISVGAAQEGTLVYPRQQRGKKATWTI